MQNNKLAIIGGSGFYEWADGSGHSVELDTPFGAPSAPITRLEIDGLEVLFLPRHGIRHQLPPHKIPFRANVWALHHLGARRIIAPSAVGSLQPHIAPGSFVINDQFVDRTSGRPDTFYDGPNVVHVSPAEPYCPQLRGLAAQSAKALSIPVHQRGTCVTIQGPRFSTKAESQWFTQMGWDVVTMTQYPEVILARELALCYINVSLVTDYDAGVVSGTAPVQASSVLEVLRTNTENMKRLIRHMLPAAAALPACACADALEHAQL